MPVHDWTRVRPGTFHDFHTAWITHLKESLNAGILPSKFYALAEQIAGEIGPDVLTLETTDGVPDSEESHPSGVIAVAEAPPQVALTVSAESAVCASKRRTLVIRHATNDRVVAFIEILSPGNKNKKISLDAFLDKALSALKHGHHLLVIDLFPPGRFDPAGIHGAVWSEIDDSSYESPRDKPLTLAAYCAGYVPTAYVEPTAIGLELPDMPLFLDPACYVNVPLEKTYMQAWQGVPERWRSVVEGE